MFLQAVGEEGEQVEMDVVLEAPGLVVYIDVAVVDPGCPKYVRAGSDRNELAAARHREAAKLYEFRRRMPNTDVACFVPFVVETSGRLGTRAAAFLVGRKLPDDVTRRLCRAIVSFLARHGGRALSALRDGW